MSLGLKDFKLGSVLKFQGEPFLVVYYQHARKQQRKPVARTKLKSLVTGSVIEKNFNASDNIELADLERQKAQFLYRDDEHAYFMNSASFDQFEMPLENLGTAVNFLKDGLEVDVLYFEGKPITVNLPNKVAFKVTETVAGVKGDTAQGRVTKPATIETGHTVPVPLFIKEGDEILINTETGEYGERVNN